jgi:hypothetical protein
METEQINLVVGDRHPIDVLRTLAHELVHARQREQDELDPGDGATGSDAENQANAAAGVLMRDFGKQHPEFFELKESKEFYYKELYSPGEVMEYVKHNIMPVLRENCTQLTHWVNIRTISSRIFNKNSVTESALQDSEKILNTFKRLDQRKNINIKIGSTVAVINLVMSSHGGFPHLFGSTAPKTITKIYREPTEKTIVKLEFNNDPDDVWPRQYLAKYKGQPIDHSALFSTQSAAELAVTMLLTSAPQDMPINIDGLDQS